MKIIEEIKHEKQLREEYEKTHKMIEHQKRAEEVKEITQ